VIRLRQANRAEPAKQQSQEIWAQLHQSVESAAAELHQAASDAVRNDAEAGAELDRVSALLKESPAQRVISPDSAKLSRQAQDDRLDEAADLIETALRRAQHVSQKLAIAGEQSPAAQPSLDAESKLARKEKVTAWLEAAENSWLKDLESNARVLRYAFAAEALPVADHGWRQALANLETSAAGVTDLGAALNRAAQDAAKQSVDAVVMITDGGHNTADDPREIATALRGVPLHIVPIGTVMPRDVILHHTHAPRAVFKNDTVVVDAMVTAYSCEGELLKVELLSDGNVVDHQTLAVSSYVFDGRVALRWKAGEFGRHALKVRVAAVPREHSVENNEAQTEVDVMEDTIRVLIADNLPRWEFRYLVNLFKRDKHVDFEQLLFEPNDDPRTSAARPSFPHDLEGWRKYRVVILGDVTPVQLPPAQQELLRKYVVEEGGNLIVIAGETAMPAAFAAQPLGAMVPAVASPPGNPAQGLGLVVTAEGSVSVATQLENDPLASDRIWREMSTKLPVYNLSPIAKPKPTSHVLIAATNPRPGAEPQAFLSWQYIGSGRVIYLAAPVTYQLRYRNGDLYHHRFWGQLLRWAIAREMGGGSRTVHLATDKALYQTGDPAQIILRLSQMDGKAVEGAQCTVEARKEGALIQVVQLHEEPGSPGTYHGTFADLPVGPITLRAAGTVVRSLLAAEGRADAVEQVLNVDPKGPTEMSNPLCNLPLLNQIAAASGGSVVPPAAIQNALSHLSLAPEVQQTVLSRRPVWNRWILLWVFMGCLTFEWLARRYWRMI
jgi:hypothetical protein